ncbi:MAG: ABC transporter ATP-binding protein [Acidobacteria bacterium]|nr:MAG: ABC transporter ATP-binding protein [Acidobacteriota bacterium]
MPGEPIKDAKEPRAMRDWAPYFLPLLRPLSRPLGLATLALVFDAVLTVMRPWPLKVVIDRVLSHRASRVPLLRHWLDNAPYSRIQILYGVCAAMLLIALLTGLLTYYYTRLLGDVGQRFVFAMRRDLFARMQRLSLRFHDSQRTGDLTHRLTSDIGSIQDMIANGVIVFGSNAFVLVAMVTLMFWLDWRFALAALSVAPPLFWTVFRYTRRIKTAARRARKSTGLMAALAQEALASIRIVQGLAQEEQLDERFGVRSEGYLQAYLESVRYQARVAPLVDGLAAVGLTIVMWYGAMRVLAGELSTGDVVIFFSYVTSLYNPMKALARFSSLYNKAAVSAERIIEVMSVRNELTDRKGARPAPLLRGAIEFRDVTFEYEPGQAVLAGIRLSITPGEKLAIVGATGAGKSTLVSLIPRFYDPTDGVVSIDGEDIRNYTLQSLREQISLVLQDSLLFSGTIRENITFGQPGASDEEMVAAAVTANAEEFIRRLPEGPVSERATTLSGGQKQRIAIARAVLRNAPILILDEPTSGLDAAAERTVMDALERASTGRTTLIIAHRLSTVRLADRIIVLEHGRLVEEGTHAELLRCNGKYARFYKFQVAGRGETALLATGQTVPSE